MLKFGVATAAAVVTSMAMASVPSRAEPIDQTSDIFAVIDRTDGDRISLSLLHSIESRDLATILFVGDKLQAEHIQPPYPSGRQKWCVTAILPRQGQGQAKTVARGLELPQCYAMVHTFRGQAGLTETDVGQVVRIMLTGDLVFDGNGEDEVLEK